MSDGVLAPPAAVRRLPPLRRLERLALAPGVIRVLLDSAEVLSEGEVRETASEPTYFGSTMLTVDLRSAARLLRIEPDRDGPGLAERLACSAELRLRAIRLARLEAERRAGGRLPGTTRAEVSVRALGAELLVDVEIELSVDTGAEAAGEQAP